MKNTTLRLAISLLLIAALVSPNQSALSNPLPPSQSEKISVQFDGQRLYDAVFKALWENDIALANKSVREAWMAKYRMPADPAALQTEKGTDEQIEKMIQSLHERFNYYLSESSTKGEAHLEVPELIGIGVNIQIKGAAEEASKMIQNGKTDNLAFLQAEAIRIFSTAQASEKTPIEVIEVIPGGPAAKAGITSGDQIQSIDGISVTGKNLTEVVELLRGKENSKVEIKLRRSSQLLTFRIARGKVVSRVVHFETLPGAIAYIRLDDFMSVYALQEMVDALDRATTESKATILDLRGNPGGKLETVEYMIELFLESGQVIRTVAREGDQLVETRIDVTPTYRLESDSSHAVISERLPRIVPTDMPVVVLVDEHSASASEILAGSLQANHVATIVGAPTYSKGVGQVPVELPFGRSLHVTMLEFFPGGKKVDFTGVVPDVKVAQPTYFWFGLRETDAQLRAAMEVATKQIEATQKLQQEKRELCIIHHQEFEPKATSQELAKLCADNP